MKLGLAAPAAESARGRRTVTISSAATLETIQRLILMEPPVPFEWTHYTPDIMLRTFALVLLTLPAAIVPQASSAWLEPYRPVAQRLITESQRSDFAWQRLAELTDTFGHRLSGSETLEQAIDWAVATMKKDGLENVHKEPVMVPNWVRGQREPRDRRSRSVSRCRCSASATPSARRPAASKPTSSSFSSFDELDRDAATSARAASCSSTCRSRTTAKRSRIARSGPVARRGARARSRCSCAPSARRAAHAAHRRATLLRGRQPQIPAAAITTRRRRPVAADARTAACRSASSS